MFVSIAFSIYTLYDTKLALQYYIYGIIVNIILCFIIKYSSFRIETKKIDHPIPFDEYGIFSPSDSVQFSIYSFLYVLLVQKVANVILLALTWYSIYNANSHTTTLEIVIGILFGIGFSFVFYHYLQLKLKGEIKCSPDDNCLIKN
jgi:hypothetical protein